MAQNTNSNKPRKFNTIEHQSVLQDLIERGKFKRLLLVVSVVFIVMLITFLVILMIYLPVEYTKSIIIYIADKWGALSLGIFIGYGAKITSKVLKRIFDDIS